MSYFNRAGVRYLTIKELTQKEKGCNTGQCPHPAKSAPYPLRKGDSDALTLPPP